MTTINIIDYNSQKSRLAFQVLTMESELKNFHSDINDLKNDLLSGKITHEKAQERFKLISAIMKDRLKIE